MIYLNSYVNVHYSVYTETYSFHKARWRKGWQETVF